MVCLSSLKLRVTSTKQSLVYSIDWIEELHQSRRFWQKPSGH
ncbi:hypothetical protein Goarm_022912 [Gossypium armourianum]|uniref:Uncharacterized protein n=1 Tax=Gossypium armourianum TaxID=34283 RepID=A0A7J9KF65_9ROSI|nr:hypothetical protein [Gossypium armourianum]